jgi:hypothetical protein
MMPKSGSSAAGRSSTSGDRAALLPAGVPPVLFVSGAPEWMKLGIGTSLWRLLISEIAPRAEVSSSNTAEVVFRLPIADVVDAEKVPILRGCKVQLQNRRRSREIRDKISGMAFHH